MKIKIITSVFISILISAGAFSEEVPDAVKALESELRSIGTNAVIIDAVKKHNAQGLSQAEIDKRDKEWRSVSGLDSFMEGMMNNTAAKELLKFEQLQSYYLELFAMGDKGANFAMTNKTSDYWQGDEAKWQKSFAGGSGAVHYGEVEFDESAQAYLIQVSVPIMDGSSAIGAITIGIDLDELGI